MSKKNLSYPLIAIWVMLLTACNGSRRPPAHDIAASPEQLTIKTTDNIRKLLNYSKENKGEIGDSIFLYDDSLVRYTYEKNYFLPFWSTKEEWKAYADSFFYFLGNAKLYGLFPEDYHFGLLDSIQKRIKGDSAGNSDRRDAALWSRADLLLTDAFLRVIKDVKMGRLPKDSITLRTDSVLLNDFYLKQFNVLKQSGSLSRVVHDLEPKHKGYQLLKEGIKKFLDSADNRELTVVPLPGKNVP
ncbi:MAG TPA: hypothetical protein VI461_17885, partial [Chitinophagaceae bacterium]|nr:hypothetical protein [Chitinophagaceae bacterium]